MSKDGSHKTKINTQVVIVISKNEIQKVNCYPLIIGSGNSSIGERNDQYFKSTEGVHCHFSLFRATVFVVNKSSDSVRQ